MHDEDDFLRKLLENPADDTTRLVYADWLDERDDTESHAKALFLRLTVQLLEPNRSEKWREDWRKNLQPLAATLPTNWLAVVSRLKVEICGTKRAASEFWERYRRQFDFVCDRRWDELTVTDDNAVRFCEGCKENVHYCDTISAAREHAQQGHCVAVDLGIIRHEDDLSPPVMMMGKPTPRFMERERRRLAIDEVSRERERRKRTGDAE